jgi:hypothetical protein
MWALFYFLHLQSLAFHKKVQRLLVWPIIGSRKLQALLVFSNEAPHSKLVLQKIPKILNLVNVNWQDDATILGFTKGDVQEMT